MAEPINIDHLNRWLGEALGCVGGSSRPRFCWAWAPDMKYYLRLGGLLSTVTEYCWADRLGKVWMLAQWRAPELFDAETGTLRTLNESDWWDLHHGESPYPAHGQYYANAETALAPGDIPSVKLTANYIWALDRQMSTTHQSHALAVKHETEAREKKNKREWNERTQDFAPAFDHWDSGARGSHVSFGGV